MKPNRFVLPLQRGMLLLTAAAGFALPSPVYSQTAAERDAVLAQEDLEDILTRGPVHEAFAGVVTWQPVEGMTVDREPPAAVNEVPPDLRPEGDNVMWIPGYWGWDDERNDFLWVSGVWRNLPPGRQWIPGYWSRVNNGYAWTSGYWADSEVAEVEYLPEPPASLEAGPNVAAPSDEWMWQPGTWVWQGADFGWRAGFWCEARPDWIWTPAHYVRTPRGCVFVDGYWDYAVERRGVIFAPVYFHAHSYRAERVWTPQIVISLSVFSRDLFVRPRAGHYYYGDFYGDSWADRGFYSPWRYDRGRTGCDPIYRHARWEHRSDRDWERTYAAGYAFRAEHVEARPPHTWSELRRRESLTPPAERHVAMAGLLRDAADRGDHGQRYRKVDEAERKQFAASRAAWSDFRGARRERESGRAPAVAGADKGREQRLKTPPSPAVSRIRAEAPRVPNPATGRPEVRNPESRRPETPAPDVRKPGDRTPEVRKPDVRKPETRKPETVRPDVPRPGTRERDVPRVPSVRPDPTPRVDPPRVTPRPQPVPRVDPPRAIPRPETRPETRPAPKVQPRPAPKPEPRVVPRAEPRPAPKVQPRPAPKPEPRVVPRAEPRPAPKVQPRPAPRPAAPKVAPRPEPRAVPKPAPATPSRERGSSEDDPRRRRK